MEQKCESKKAKKKKKKKRQNAKSSLFFSWKEKELPKSKMLKIKCNKRTRLRAIRGYLFHHESIVGICDPYWCNAMQCCDWTPRFLACDFCMRSLLLLLLLLLFLLHIYFVINFLYPYVCMYVCSFYWKW